MEVRPNDRDGDGAGWSSEGHRKPSLLLFGHATWRPPGGGAGPTLPHKAFVLVALLLLAFGGRASRPALAARLYEDTTQGGALANFRQLIARIQRWQRASGVELIEVAGGEVAVARASSAPACDLAAFQELAPPRDAGALTALASLYRGDLLESLSGCGPILETWVATHRHRLRERYAEFAVTGAKHVRGADGTVALRQLVDVDPYNEEAWRALIDLRAEREGVEAAAATYEEMRAVFDEELDARPEAHTAALMSGLGTAPALSTARPAHRVEAQGAVEHRQPVEVDVPRLCLLMPPATGTDAVGMQLAQALIEDVTLGLCRLRSLAMIAPHTAWHLTNGERSGERFGIDYVAETAIRRFGDASRLVVKLVRTADRRILWGEQFDIRAGLSPDHYHGISRAVALALADGVEQAEFAHRPDTDKPDAYRFYLMGRYHLRTLDLPALRRARRAFSQALDLSPTFVPALNGLSRTMTLEWLLLARTEKDLLRQSERVAGRAIQIDPMSGEALREGANALLFLGAMDEAVEKLAEAERLLPHHADILADNSNALTHASQPRLALERIETAMRLNPVTPDNYLWQAGGTLFFLERYDEAVEHLQRMAKPAPASRLTAACLVMAGRRSEAQPFVRRALADQPNFTIDEWVSTIPIRSGEHTARYVHALRSAGFR